jgi:multimeric flavodoxin WrbA
MSAKRVTVFVGSARKGNTHKAVIQFVDSLRALGDVECEIVTLSKYRLESCRGCFRCFEKGEEFCPLKDDRDVLMDKIKASDGVVFATPNYCFQVSGILKTFIDRFGFMCHRPRYFGKTFTSIVTQGFGGGDKIVDYLDLVAGRLGFNTVKGVRLTALIPTPEKEQRRIDRALEEQSRRFYARLTRASYPAPTLYELMGFRMGRATVKQLLDDRSRDYTYYAEKGWLESDYFYPTRLGVLKRALGRLFDSMAPTVRRMIA